MAKRQELVATKISSEAWLRLNDISKRLGLTPYRLVQETIDTLILYMDEGRQLSDSMQTVIDCFERFEGWGQICRLTDIKPDWQVLDAIYFLRDGSSNGYAGVIGCWSKPSFMGQHSSSFNKKEMLEMFVRRLFPDMHRELALLGMQEETNGTLETMRRVIQNQLDDPDKQAIRELFADCGRTEYGRSTELVKYVRHNRKDPYKVGTKPPVQLYMFNEENQEDKENGKEEPGRDTLQLP